MVASERWVLDTAANWATTAITAYFTAACAPSGSPYNGLIGVIANSTRSDSSDALWAESDSDEERRHA